MRYAFTRAGRVWRKGLRAFVVGPPEDLDARVLQEGRAAGEVYATYPPDAAQRTLLGAPWAGLTAMTPLLAYRHYGGRAFKWLLFGADDTAFFAPAVRRLAAQLNADMPYVLTDRVIFGGAHDEGQAQYQAPYVGGAGQCLAVGLGGRLNATTTHSRL